VPLPPEVDQARRALRRATTAARWWARQLNPTSTARPPAASRQLPYWWNGPPPDPARYLTRADACRRAIRAYRKAHGWWQVWAAPMVHNDRLYVAVLAAPPPPPCGPVNGAFAWHDGVSGTVPGIPHAVVAVYRVHRDGRLRRLAQRPPWLQLEHWPRESAAEDLREIYF
jgi:hypothetical protein